MNSNNILLSFDFAEDFAVEKIVLSKCKKSTFLVGCYRSQDKKQLDWILGVTNNRTSILYNVRSGKKREGWVDVENPKVKEPTFVILYDLENPNTYQAYKVGSCTIYSQGQMLKANYPSPNGNYLVYTLIQQLEIEEFSLEKFLENYKLQKLNYIKGKPIYCTGTEIINTIIQKQTNPKRAKCNAQDTYLQTMEILNIEDIKEQLKHQDEYPADALTSIDLFSGCGGLTKGFSMSGVRSIFASDIDENCEKTFTRNFPETPFLCKDITEIRKEEVDALTGGVVPDIITGGPPCQGFSLANKRRNKVQDDPRNKLFYGFVKFINWYSPKAFVMENVKGLLSMQNGEVIKTIMEEFSNAGECGYNVAYKVLKASDYGVPQNRERVILIGFRKDLNINPVHPEPYIQDHLITVDEAISDLPQIEAGQGTEVQKYSSEPQNEYQRLMRSRATYVLNHVAMKHTPRLIARFKAIQPGQNLLDVWDTHGALKRGAPTEKSTIKFSQNNQRLHGNLPAPTIAASFQSNFIHPHLHRNFTAREGARLQSFPDDFIFEGMRTKMSWEKGLSQYQQIGNAVPVLLAKAIADSVINQLNTIQQ
jgi:DNA (cytosine-5)-methyltransferase 1